MRPTKGCRVEETGGVDSAPPMYAGCEAPLLDRARFAAQRASCGTSVAALTGVRLGIDFERARSLYAAAHGY